MRILFTLLLLCFTARAAIFQNSFTTNSTGKTSNTIPSNNTSTLYPLMILNPDGSGVDRTIYFNAALTMTGTNASIGGDLFVTNIFTTVVNATTVKINGKNASVTSVNGTNITPLNLTNTATVTWAYDGSSNVTATATASGGGLTTDVTTLAYSGTNITGFDASTNGMSYYLLLTNHCLFGASTFSNLPAKTAYKTFTLCLQQDSTGTWVPKFTNTIVDAASGVIPVIPTNANSVSYLYFHTSLATNSRLAVTPNLDMR